MRRGCRVSILQRSLNTCQLPKTKLLWNVGAIHAFTKLRAMLFILLKSIALGFKTLAFNLTSSEYWAVQCVLLFGEHSQYSTWHFLCLCLNIWASKWASTHLCHHKNSQVLKNIGYCTTEVNILMYWHPINLDSGVTTCDQIDQCAHCLPSHFILIIPTLHAKYVKQSLRQSNYARASLPKNSVTSLCLPNVETETGLEKIHVYSCYKRAVNWQWVSKQRLGVYDGFLAPEISIRNLSSWRIWWRYAVPKFVVTPLLCLLYVYKVCSNCIVVPVGIPWWTALLVATSFEHRTTFNSYTR